MFSLNDYEYQLPQELIAQFPAEPADSCKLLIYDKNTKEICNSIFNQLPELIDSNTLIVLNTSKVIKARIPLFFSDNTKGEIFYLNAHDAYSFDALVRPGKKFRTGEVIYLDTGVSFSVEAVTKDGRYLTCSKPILEVLEKYGQMPLPPYISYDEIKAVPYQPIFAHHPGSVASPTASLHFTQLLLDKLKSMGVKNTEVVLHVGLGTFKQVDTEDIRQYKIHSEQIEITVESFKQITLAKLAGKKILSIGTTVARTLETLPYARQRISQTTKQLLFSEEIISYRDNLVLKAAPNYSKKYVPSVVYNEHSKSFIIESKLFIYPGFTFLIVDELITNFHLPKSSLLMMVAAFMGYEEMKKVYAHAITEEYMFYSFGDAMRIRV